MALALARTQTRYSIPRIRCKPCSEAKKLGGYDKSGRFMPPCTLHHVYHAPCIPCTMHTMHHKYHAPCTTYHVPCIPCTIYTMHHVYHAPRTMHHVLCTMCCAPCAAPCDGLLTTTLDVCTLYPMTVSFPPDDHLACTLYPMTVSFPPDHHLACTLYPMTGLLPS